MSAKGNTLATNQFLSVGDYLVSNNGVFFAVLQSDGNFCVYRGAGPSNNLGFLWGSVQTAGYQQAEGDYFICMQSDGNFCCYRSKTPPGTKETFVWGTVQLGGYAPAEGQYSAVLQDDGNFGVYKQGTTAALYATNVTDPVTDVASITSIVYDLASGKTLQTSPADLYRQTVYNNTGVPQSSEISGSASISETSGWSDALAIKIGVETTFKTGVPYVAEGKITASLEVSNTFEWNGSETTEASWEFNTPVAVPPNLAIVALVAATVSTIAVPYTLTGTFILKSMIEVPGHVSGVYTGTNAHDLTITFTPVGAGSANAAPTTMALNATPH